MVSGATNLTGVQDPNRSAKSPNSSGLRSQQIRWKSRQSLFRSRNVTAENMHAIFIVLLLICGWTKADILFRDEAQAHGYVFESNEKDLEATSSEDDVVKLAG